MWRWRVRCEPGVAAQERAARQRDGAGAARPVRLVVRGTKDCLSLLLMITYQWACDARQAHQPAYVQRRRHGRRSVRHSSLRSVAGEMRLRTARGQAKAAPAADHGRVASGLLARVPLMRRDADEARRGPRGPFAALLVECRSGCGAGAHQETHRPALQASHCKVPTGSEPKRPGATGFEQRRPLLIE